MNSSVIITTYQRPDFLLRAVKSVLAQSVPTEVVVVDDNGLGTEDQLNTQIVLQPFLDKITYLPLEKNGGACMARNEGVKIASGDYIFFLDDDDEFLPDKVKIQTEFLKNNKEYDGCLAAFKRIDDTEKKEIIADANFPVVGDLVNFAIHGNFFTPMLCVRREAFLKTGGFDVISRYQDRYWMIKALELGMSFICLDKELHIMYEHDDHRITSSSADRSFQSLDTIKKRLSKNKSQFSNSQWNLFLIKDYRMRGVIYYTSDSYSRRLKSIPYFYKSFLLSKSLSDLKSIVKALVKT